MVCSNANRNYRTALAGIIDPNFRCKNELMTVDWRAEYPFESHFLELGSHRYHFVDEGIGDQPIVCVHGNPTWSFHFRRLISQLRTRTRVLAVDHLGCGLSDKPQDYDYCLAHHIDNFVEFLRRQALTRVVLVVHDWGGAIGLGAALRESNRIEKILILNTGAFPPPYLPLRIAMCRLPLIGTLAVRGLNAFSVAATRMAMHRPEKLSTIARAGLLAPYHSWRTRIAVDRFVKDIPRRETDATWKLLAEIESALPKLSDRPIKIVWGMRDWCFRPECLDRFCSLFPNADVRRLADVGHYVMEEAPEEVCKAAAELLVWRGET